MMARQNAISAGAAGILAVLTATGSALAQDAAPAKAAVRFIAEQPASEWLARVYIGSKVQNSAGETVGDVNDIMFDRTGRISTVVLGVGGFLGMGERNVAVPFETLSYTSGKDGARVIVVPTTKEALMSAPPFVAVEKTTFDSIKDKAVQIKDQAAKTIHDMTKGEPAKQ